MGRYGLSVVESCLEWTKKKRKEEKGKSVWFAVEQQRIVEAPTTVALPHPLTNEIT